METKKTFIDVLKVLAPMWGIMIGAAIGWMLFTQLWQILVVAVLCMTAGQIYYREIISADHHFTAITWVVACFFFFIPVPTVVAGLLR
ncbi:hypothetical protein J2X72_001256 [Phyllobacterium sp. 1468]|uniref:hypothetical protein n=1 Tax=Phyllobacterium sp. 1468 TaxID=2817759 RepID=UPI0028673D2A|nr:hypothetical protein [Phyllobacterium sp. 1468]MDR6632472.1 hypothetical protein [Phyllobacterium sp. 1468]